MSGTVRYAGRKTFSSDDQELFARVSRDCNPMHMDPVAARRLIAGRQVVHGMHIVLTALENWHCDTVDPLTSIDCTFRNPVSVGDQVDFKQLDEAGQPPIVEASVDGLVCARVSLVRTCQTERAREGGNQVREIPNQDICFPYVPGRPLDEAPEFFQGKGFRLELDTSDLSAYFPHSLRYLGYNGLASTLALSFIVGMVCPGLHSVFSSFTMHLPAEPAGDKRLRFSLLKYDSRFGLFDISFHGVTEGLIKAFQRPPAIHQPSVLELSHFVGAEEFKGTRSLVIGGSRGLGEVTAKLLAAGGGDTVITYATGAADAEAVEKEINAGTRAQCRVLHLDLSSQRFDPAAIDWNALDGIYYFATPRIFRKKGGIFDARLFREFCDFYVSSFHELCVFLESTLIAGKVKVYFPSTVFIEERPKGMAEYAMAKAAAEVLVQEINRSFGKLTVLCTRLPRLSTDQTASIVKIKTGSNAQALVPVIRSMQACD